MERRTCGQTFIRGLTRQDLKRGQDVDDGGNLATRTNFRFGGLELSEKELEQKYWEPNIFKNNTYSVRHTTYIEERPSRIQKVFIHHDWCEGSNKTNSPNLAGQTDFLKVEHTCAHKDTDQLFSTISYYFKIYQTFCPNPEWLGGEIRNAFSDSKHKWSVRVNNTTKNLNVHQCLIAKSSTLKNRSSLSSQKYLE